MTAAAAGAGLGADTAPSTSPLVTRPSLPDPATEPGARLLSAMSLAAAGMATPAMDPPVDGDAAAAGRAAGVAADAAAGAAALALPSVSMRAMSCSATTVPPSPTRTSANTPADGAGTSRTTLSVSISIRISSAATASPGFFFHCSIVASATDSDSCGTLTSMIAISILSVWSECAVSQLPYLVRMKPLSLANAPSTSAFCCSWCRWE
ncbi:MAG: hypothetical protein BWX79_01529 [Alphaproteobacteria bacterium ADurb.Bin100]|nr:MAG: hypothetical protein BWX79_01529 [Alphaproteobacteria bacterium ADurb.Bin100]